MARVLVSTLAKGNRVAKTYRDTEWGEFRTVFYVDNIKQKGADNHTDDKEDAINTAKYWVEQEEVRAH